MATIDTLQITFSTRNATNAVNNIKAMAEAVNNLANGLKGLETGKFNSFAQSMGVLKSNAPTDNQAKNMKNFADGVSQLAAAVNGANLTGFATDISNISNGAQGLGARATRNLTNLVAGLAQVGQQAQAVANTVQTAQNQMPNGTMNANNGNAVNSVQTMVAELDKAASRVDAIRDKFKGIFVPTKQFKSLEEQTERVARRYDELRERMQNALNNGDVTVDSEQYQSWARDLEAIRNEYDRLILKQRELTIEGGGIKLNPTILGTLNAFKQGFTQVTDIIKNGFNAAMRAASNHISSFVGRAKSAILSLKKTTTSGFKATDMAKKLSKELLRITKMLKLMITRMALRKVIEEVGNGFKSLALHCKTFDDSMSNVINSSKKLGYSFAAMVEPIINALAPALIYLIELLTRVINALNQLFSALGGGTVWHKAKDFTGSWSDSIKEANKNAKELKKTVLGFDELNQLTDNSNSGGGGNGITDMFEDVNIDPKWLDFAQWLKDMWAKGDFTELGKLWGENLRDLLESIPWDLIRETSHKLGESIATLINGFVEVERLGYDIGYTIAQSVNTVFEFINGFVHKLHWNSIGKFIADTFNGFFESIDWDLIKDTVITGLRGVATAIWGFIQMFHWDNISDFIKNGLDTIASGIKAFFETEGYDERGFKLNGTWAQRLGREIGDQLKKVFKDKELWREVGEAIGDMIQGAIDFVSEFVNQIEVKDVVDALTNLINGFFEKVDMNQAGHTLGKILQGIIDFIKQFLKENGVTIVKEIGSFLKGIWDELDKGDIAAIGGAALGLALLNAFRVARLFLIKALLKEGIGKAIANAIFGTAAGGAGAAGAGAGAAGAAGGSELIGSATVAGSSIAAGLVGGIVAFIGGSEIGKWLGKKIFPDDKELYERYSGIKGTLQLYKDFAITVAEEVGYAWENAKTSLSAKWDEIKEAAGLLKERTSEHLQNLKDKAIEAFDKIDSKVNEFGNSINQKKENIKTAFANMKDNVATKLGEFDASVKEKFENAKASIKSFGEDASAKFEDFKSKLATFKENASTKLSEFKDDWKTKLDDAENTFTEFKDRLAKAFGIDEWTFSGVAEGLKKTFADAKEAIAGVWNGIADKVNGEHTVGSSKIKINLPKIYAQGGFPEDGLFFANHHELVGGFSNGKTAVANNGQIIEGIKQGVYEANMRSNAQNNGNGKYIVTEVYFDSEKAGRFISKGQEKANRRYSPSMV